MNTPDSPRQDGVDASKEQQLWRICFWSFFLSQGDPGLQHNLLKYVRGKNAELHLTHDDLERMQGIFEKRLRAFIPKTPKIEAAHFAVPLDSQIRESTNTVSRHMHNLFCEPQPPLDRAKLLTRIPQQMLTRDREFFCSQTHRPEKSMTPDQSFLTDPWLSHVEYFLVEGHPINVPEYDALFEELRPMVKQLLEDPESTFRKDYDEMLYVRNANRKGLENA